MSSLDISTDARKYFSKISDIQNLNIQFHIDLGKLTATAKVKVYGKYIAGVWPYPYRVNVKDAVKPGKL
ncbi:hypothetical protein [Filimonas lacunae]|uniref:hypothetical protein n=1 Tax=Filimonas lacunae TaxID=477680 RepID=UPI0007D710D2|nr:hypothetical protein [Filimonas lacunae]BAV06302.1 hypothetical protein FLA_2318 [Filimonas lacunae]